MFSTKCLYICSGRVTEGLIVVGQGRGGSEETTCEDKSLSR
jgi:hypothetical protein